MSWSGWSCDCMQMREGERLACLELQQNLQVKEMVNWMAANEGEREREKGDASDDPLECVLTNW